MKSYILYMGGTFGDITEKIVNDGIILSHELKSLLKLRDEISPKIKEKILSSKCNIFSGHNFYPLMWNLKNYKIVINDEKVIDKCAKRFYVLYPEILQRVLNEVYPQSFLEKIKNEKEKIKFYKILIKNYNHKKNKECKILNFNDIYNQKKFLETLNQHFNFDYKIGKQIYDEWYEKEISLLKLTESFD